ncbi:MAG: nuclear transport factor 2 family protein [Alphaproteobacteria bacterium]|nr:nuclear transport factor 2 family protein [Alphaproteobacteria bacterium]
MKLTHTLPLVIALTASTAAPVLAKEAETRAANEYALSTAVATASRAWRDAFNAGDAAAAAALYEEDAIMVAKPFGTFEGRDAIQAFWENLIKGGFDDVVYYNTSTTIVDQTLTAAKVSAEWKMNNAHGIITNEHWVLQPDGTALLREDHFEVAQ